MLPLNQMEEVILDQREIFLRKNTGIPRQIGIEKYLKSPQIIVISGIRRSGKSTFLRQISEKLPDFCYANFDDERLLHFSVEDFQNLQIIWQKHGTSKNILMDEIQNIPYWERFVRRLHDEGYKIFITGSNAKMLSSELGTHLTGRYFKIEVYPFSFREFLALNGYISTFHTSQTKAKILKYFDEYLEHGGFPEFLQYHDFEVLQRIYEDIVYKDIIARFGIREIKTFREISHFLFTNFTSEISYNNLKKILGIKSVMSVKKYISFLQESYLLFELYQYDYSLKKQYVSHKKIYVADNGMRNTIAFQFAMDRGKLLENMVFIELKRRNESLYYFKNRGECDFLVCKKNKIIQTIQVTQTLSSSNEKREVEGLMEAMKMFHVTDGLILTESQEKIQKIGKYTIHIQPVWKWLMGEAVSF